MSRDLVKHETTKGADIILLNAFHGGKKYGRCVQLTLATGYVQMTFKEAIDFFRTCIGTIEKVSEEYDKKPPWWERL